MGLEKNLGDVGWTGILFLWCTHRYGLPLACALAQGFIMCNSPCTSLPSVPVCFSCSVSTACGERSRPLSFCSLAACVLCFNFRFPAPFPCWVFGLLGVFLSNCVFHPVADRCVRRRLLATSNPPSQIAMDDRRCRGEKFARKTTLRGSQFLPSSSPASRFQPLYR